jgi:hypothetical protein
MYSIETPAVGLFLVLLLKGKKTNPSIDTVIRSTTRVSLL